MPFVGSTRSVYPFDGPTHAEADTKYLANQDAGESDLNSIIQSGVYGLGTANPNMPSQVQGGQLIVSQGAGTTVTQIVTDAVSGRMFWRSGVPLALSGVTDVWGDWSEVYHSLTDKRGDFAWKQAPTAFVSDYTVAWGQGSHDGDSMDALETGNGIRIKAQGFYLATYEHRKVGATASPYAGIGLNGDRAGLDRNDGTCMWNHSHVNHPSDFVHSTYLGELNAGDLITAGPPATYSVDFTYATQGYAGTLHILRLK